MHGLPVLSLAMISKKKLFSSFVVYLPLRNIFKDYINLRSVSLVSAVLKVREQILSWGIPEIDTTLRELTTQIEHEATKLGFQTMAAHHRIGHMIGLRYPSRLPADLSKALTEANVFVSIRGQSIRVSPYLYNTLEDIEQLFRVLKRII